MSNKFSILIIPDTQEACRLYPEILKNMYDKINENINEWNVKKVLHLGDIVNDGNKDENQFIINNLEYNKFDSKNIPYLISIGNHDYDNLVSINRDALMYNKYFGLNRYRDKPWYGGTFEENKSENMYTILKINNNNYLFLSLEFGPRDEVIDWANNILTKYKDFNTYIITHSHIYIDAEHTNKETKYNAKAYSGLENANNGEDLWEKLFKNHNNIIAVFSGHHVGKNISYRYDLNNDDSLILQAFFNWQYDLNGGEGRFLVMEVDEGSNNLSFNVFNPTLNEFEKKDGYEFNLPIKASKEKYLNYKFIEE